MCVCVAGPVHRALGLLGATPQGQGGLGTHAKQQGAEAAEKGQGSLQG